MRGRRASSLIDTGKSNGKDTYGANGLTIAHSAQLYRMMKSKRMSSTSISKAKVSASRAG